MWIGMQRISLHPYEQQSLPEVLAPPATADSQGGKEHETQNGHNRNNPHSCPGKAVALPALLFSPSWEPRC